MPVSLAARSRRLLIEQAMGWPGRRSDKEGLLGGVTELRVALDGGIIDDPARVWPVMVDPSFYAQKGPGDTYVVEDEHQTPEPANLHATEKTP